MKKTLVVTILAASAYFVVPAYAHHSFAMFDRTADKVLSNAIVKELEWTNPHTWLEVLVTNPDGTVVEWGLECGPINSAKNHGWTKRTFSPGDKIPTLTIHPLKDGRPGGQFVKAVLANGKIVEY
jgi:hypothetical protein